MKLGGWSCTGRGLVRFRLAGSQRSRRALCLASTVGGNAEPRRGLPTLLGVSLQDDLHWRRPPGRENGSRVSRPGLAVPTPTSRVSLAACDRRPVLRPSAAPPRRLTGGHRSRCASLTGDGAACGPGSSRKG